MLLAGMQNINKFLSVIFKRCAYSFYKVHIFIS